MNVQTATTGLVVCSKDIYVIAREIIQVFQALQICSPRASPKSNCVYLMYSIGEL